MSESSFSMTITPRTIEDGFRIISGFRKIRNSKGISESEIKKVLSETIGKEFVEVLTKKLSTTEDVKYFSDFFKSTESMNNAIAKVNIYGKNPNCLWIESTSKCLEPWEVCPDRITLYARSKVHRDYSTSIELDYSFTETAEMKAAVFAKAFIEAKVSVSESGSWNDDEHDDE